MSRLHEKLPLQYHPRKIRPPNQYGQISKSKYRVAFPFKGKLFENTNSFDLKPSCIIPSVYVCIIFIFV